MVNQDFIAIDPVLGEVSCDTPQGAAEYAQAVRGEAYIVDWKDGREYSRSLIYPRPGIVFSYSEKYGWGWAILEVAG